LIRRLSVRELTLRNPPADRRRWRSRPGRLRELPATTADSTGIATETLLLCAEELRVCAGHELRRAGRTGIEDRVHQ
jgi:hypothetical protein